MKDEALKLALRSLKELVPDDSDYAPALQGQRKRQEKAIAAIKQALEQPVQQSQSDVEPVAWRVKWPAIGGGHKWIMVDKPLMEREGFVNEALYTTPPAAPVQEPVDVGQATMELAESVGLIGPTSRDMPDCWVVIKDGQILATHDAPSHYDGIQAVRYVPAAPVQEPEYVQIRHIDEVGDASPWGQPLDPKERHTKWAPGFEMRLLYTAPPAAQRSWVGLTDEQVTRLCKTGAVYAPDGVVTRTPLQYREELEGVARTAVRKAEAKLKELNA